MFLANSKVFHPCPVEVWVYSERGFKIVANNSTDLNIKSELVALRDVHGDVVKVSEISSVVKTIMSTIKGDLTDDGLELYLDFQTLSNYIHDEKSDIAALRPDEVRDEYTPTSADELDAIVQATEMATNTIMVSTEQINSVMEHIDSKHADQLMEVTTHI